MICSTPFHTVCSRHDPKAMHERPADPKATDECALRLGRAGRGGRSPHDRAHYPKPHGPGMGQAHASVHRTSAAVGPKSARGTSTATSRRSHTRRLGDEANLNAKLTTARSPTTFDRATLELGPVKTNRSRPSRTARDDTASRLAPHTPDSGLAGRRPPKRRQTMRATLCLHEGSAAQEPL
jgi:hypothetical protein